MSKNLFSETKNIKHFLHSQSEMHLQASIVLLCVLLNGGFGLDCYECRHEKGPCTNLACYGEQKCAAVREEQYTSGSKAETVSKKCASASECKSWSISTSCYRIEHAAECCDTNLCNDHDGPGLSSGVPNGKKCYTCDWEDCSKTLSCWGNEDYCFSKYDTGHDHSTVIKGCASKSVCDDPGLTLGPSRDITCCKGNLCNGVNRVSQSFLFLCCSLLSFIILH